MANKIFTDGSLKTLVDETKSYVDDAVSGKSDSGHTHNYAGSSSSGGAATSANKLNTSAGSTTQPVYFENGVPKATTYSLGKSVPSDAKFTDTVYTLPAAGSSLGGVKSGGDVTISSDGVITVNDDSHNHTISNVDNLQTTLDGKAPTGHASTATTYGVGTSSNYGHVKLSDSISSTDGTSAGIAATPAAVKAAYDLANGKANSSHNHSAANITSGTLAVERGGTGNMEGYVRAGAISGSTVGALATAEGRNTTASGNYSHAEGNYSEATGNSSHAEGQNTEASGIASHAEGENAVASGAYSHAEGEGTIAASGSQHVQGKYNKQDTAGTYAHIVGNGTGASTSSRSNAHTIDWNGNAWFAGDIYTGGISQSDSDASKVITKTEINDIELITIDEIDAICGASIQFVSLADDGVMF